MTGTSTAAKSDMVRARVADEATHVAVPVIVRPVATNLFPLSLGTRKVSESPKANLRDTFRLPRTPPTSLHADAHHHRSRDAGTLAPAPGPGARRRHAPVRVHGGLGALQLLQRRRPSKLAARHPQVRTNRISQHTTLLL